MKKVEVTVVMAMVGMMGVTAAWVEMVTVVEETEERERAGEGREKRTMKYVVCTMIPKPLILLRSADAMGILVIASILLSSHTTG